MFLCCLFLCRSKIVINVLFAQKLIKTCHKDICCKICNGFIHKKCTNLKPKQLKCLDIKDWMCKDCSNTSVLEDSNSELRTDINNLNDSLNLM